MSFFCFNLCYVWLLYVASSSLHIHYVNSVSIVPFLFKDFPFLCHSYFYICLFSPVFTISSFFSDILFYSFNFYIFFFHLTVWLVMFVYL
jgi:hypothetical protein